MTVWTTWELWQKMVFCLGCLIALTLVYAIFIRLRNKRRTARYAAEDAAEKAHGGQAAGRHGQSEVPFGVRCLEEGVDVEGVWSSNANTPLQSPKTSPASSPRLGPMTDSTVGANTKKAHESRLPTSKGKLEKRSRRISVSGLDGEHRNERGTEIHHSAFIGVTSTLEPPESRKSPVLETMRGRPAWQPYQRADRRPFSHSGVSSLSSGSGLAVSSPDASAPTGFLDNQVPSRTVPDVDYSSRLRRRQDSAHQRAPNAANKAKQGFGIRETDTAEAAQLSVALQTISSLNLPRGRPTAGSIEERSVQLNRESQLVEDSSGIASRPLAKFSSDIRQPTQNEGSSTKRSSAVPFKIFADNHPVPIGRYGSHSQERSNPARRSLEGHHTAKPQAHASRKSHSSETVPQMDRHSLSPGDEMPSYRNNTFRNVNVGFEMHGANTFAEPDRPWERNDIPESTRLSLERQPKRLQKRRHSESEAWSQNPRQTQYRRR